MTGGMFIMLAFRSESELIRIAQELNTKINMKVGKKKTIVKTNEFIREVNEFADICRETTGASFTISKNKIGFWTVSLVNCGKQWISSDIMDAVRGW